MKHAKNLRGVYFWDSGNIVISGSPANHMNRRVSTVNMETPTSLYCDVELQSVIRFLTLQNKLAVEIHKQLCAVYVEWYGL